MKMPKLLLFIFSVLFAQSAIAQLPPETLYGVPVEPSDLPMPGYLEVVHDDNFGIDYTRLGDIDSFSALYGEPVSYKQTRHHYAKTQAWNSDNSRLFFGFKFLADGDTYELKKAITDYMDDARWANTEPDFRYGCRGKEFRKMNVATEVFEVLVTIPSYERIGIGPWEGNLSADDRYVVLADVNDDGRGTKAAVYDIQENTLSQFYTPNETFDWATVTPSGEYVVVSKDGAMELYDLDFNYLRILSNNPQHGDFAYDVNGDEVFVGVIPLSMTRLSDGVVTDLLPATPSTSGTCGANSYNPNIGGHISGRNFDKPGWAYVSTNVHKCWNDQGYDWHNDLFAIKLDYTGTGTIMHFGSTRSLTDPAEWGSSIATVNQAGTKMIFQSNWNLYGQGIEAVGMQWKELSFLAEYANVLPVSLTDFSIRKMNNQVAIKWITLSEKNNEGFYIQRSSDGQIWNDLGFVHGQGDSNAEIVYEFIDPKPFEGRNYYRLLQKDFDEKTSFSRILSLYFEGQKISFAPNPAQHNIQFDTKGKNLNKVIIYNTLGQVVLSDLSGNTNLDISSLERGLYLVYAEGEGLLLRDRLVVE